jgi:ribokinase
MIEQNAGQIVVVGSLNLDLAVQTTRIPQPGETIIGGTLNFVPGGKGANQAVGAARLGAHVAMIGKVGSDVFAGSLLAGLDAAGVDRHFVTQADDSASGVALIVVDAQGQNSIVVAPGANAQLMPADVYAAEAAIARADVLLLQLEIPLETVQCAAEVARKHGVKVILNPAPAAPLPQSLTTLVDILIPNETETSLLTAMPVDDLPAVELAAHSLIQMGVQEIIVTMGKSGALWLTSEGVRIFEPYRVTPVDTTAAGDAFVAAFAVALAEGHDIAEAVQWGNAGGALATTRLGAQTSLPTRADLINQLRKEA